MSLFHEQGRGGGRPSPPSSLEICSSQITAALQAPEDSWRCITQFLADGFERPKLCKFLGQVHQGETSQLWTGWSASPEQQPRRVPVLNAAEAAAAVRTAAARQR